MQDELHECKILSSCQSHALTYRLAGHATFNSVPDKQRICIQIVNKVENDSKKRFSESVQQLVLKSINKYEEYAIFY